MNPGATSPVQEELDATKKKLERYKDLSKFFYFN
jgi:hypothetical protein